MSQTFKPFDFNTSVMSCLLQNISFAIVKSFTQERFGTYVEADQSDLLDAHDVYETALIGHLPFAAYGS